MSEPILTVKHLTMRFGGLLAVDDLSFSAQRGDITAIIGPNGAGKTTVFNCITGFYKPTVGMIRLTHPDGRDYLLERLIDFRIAKHARVTRTFQNIRLFPGMTGLENLLVAQHNPLMLASGYTIIGMLGLPAFGNAERAAIDKAKYWLDRIGLSQRADDPAGELPYGAQRRLEVARAMCTDPVLLCLDEPAAGLNARESADLNALLLFGESRQTQIGPIVTVVSHGTATEILRARAIVVIEILLDEAVLAEAAIERQLEDRRLLRLGKGPRNRAKKDRGYKQRAPNGEPQASRTA